jgi:colicin import membrane protein
MLQSRVDTVQATVLALLLHAALLLALWLSASWVWRRPVESAAGPAIAATLEFSAADLHRAEQAIKMSPKPSKPPTPQPLPSPKPQTSDEPLQAKPQAPQPAPDTIDQQREDPLAQQQAQEKLADEARQRQEQVDLTEDIERQKEVENQQRLRQQQLDAIRQQLQQAHEQASMEAQRLAQLADLTKPLPKPVKPQIAPNMPAGSNGETKNKGLMDAYIAALRQTAQDNWNTSLAPERVNCQVRFTQYAGGEVVNVEFLDCPYDAQARESVERALLKTPMPYAGFESVFQRQVTLKMCYPREECEP